MIDIDTLPVVIISSPRTGSTALSLTLHEKLGGVLFNEPGLDSLKLNSFLRHAAMKKDFILKEHVSTLLKNYPNFDTTGCTVIRIKRKDFISQVVSSYISLRRKTWFYTENSQAYQEEIIAYDENSLKECFSYIKNQNYICDNYKGRVDIELCYEDILTEFSNSQKTLLPKNYTDIVEWAKKIYEQA